MVSPPCSSWMSEPAYTNTKNHTTYNTPLKSVKPDYINANLLLDMRRIIKIVAKAIKISNSPVVR